MFVAFVVAAVAAASVAPAAVAAPAVFATISPVVVVVAAAAAVAAAMAVLVAVPDGVFHLTHFCRNLTTFPHSLFLQDEFSPSYNSSSSSAEMTQLLSEWEAKNPWAVVDVGAE